MDFCITALDSVPLINLSITVPIEMYIILVYKTNLPSFSWFFRIVFILTYKLYNQFVKFSIKKLRFWLEFLMFDYDPWFYNHIQWTVYFKFDFFQGFYMFQSRTMGSIHFHSEVLVKVYQLLSVVHFQSAKLIVGVSLHWVSHFVGYYYYMPRFQPVASPSAIPHPVVVE